MAAALGQTEAPTAEAAETASAEAPDAQGAKPIAELTDLDELAKIEKEQLASLGKLFKSPCFPLMISESMLPHTVDDVFQRLRDDGHAVGAESLVVVIDSGGGDINSAYNLALLFRKYAKNLHFVIPRWAKSAATLLVLSGDVISMTPIAEVGPVDPQITAFNPLENRLEEFSPLHIENTLELIRTEFADGNTKLAEGLLQRLQFPLTLGSFKTSLDVGKVYIQRLLSTRMMKDQDEDAIKRVAERFVEGYSDHGFVIGCSELQELGLNVKELSGEELDVVWSLHQLNRRRQELQRKKEEEEMQERLKDLPPGLFEAGPNTAGAAQNGSHP